MLGKYCLFSLILVLLGILCTISLFWNLMNTTAYHLGLYNSIYSRALNSHHGLGSEHSSLGEVSLYAWSRVLQVWIQLLHLTGLINTYFVFGQIQSC